MANVHRSKWFLPLFSAAIGATFLAAFWVGGNPDDGVFAAIVMVGFGALILLGGRSEFVRGLRGDGRDEYWQRIDVHATALAGNVLIVAVLAMCVWEWAHGRSGAPYVQLGAIAGIAYIGALAVLRWRS
jgi:hypothetical protein